MATTKSIREKMGPLPSEVRSGKAKQPTQTQTKPTPTKAAVAKPTTIPKPTTTTKPAAVTAKPVATVAKPVAPKQPAEPKLKTDGKHLGAYICRYEEGAVVITILKDDGTCGMFMMLNGYDVMWTGFTQYVAVDNNLRFAVQSVSDGVDKDGNTKVRAPREGDELFVDAKLDPGRGYKQGTGFFDFVGAHHLKFWNKKENSWGAIGEARRLQGYHDFEWATAVRDILIDGINMYGDIMGWEMGLD